MAEASHVAIIGGGTIGAGFAITFVRAGREVRLSDPSAERRAAIPGELASRLGDLADHHLLEEAPGAVATRIAIAPEPAGRACAGG